MGRRLVSLQLRLKRDDWRLLPGQHGRLGPLALSALLLLYPLGHSPSGLKAQETVISPAVSEWRQTDGHLRVRGNGCPSNPCHARSM